MVCRKRELQERLCGESPRHGRSDRCPCERYGTDSQERELVGLGWSSIFINKIGARLPGRRRTLRFHLVPCA